MKQGMTSLELCAGGGGQALGLEAAGFQHSGLVELDKHCCSTLQTNRPHWNVLNRNLKEFDASSFKGIDLLAAGLPCPPFSKAGKQLGEQDDRNLFPDAIRIVRESKPKAVMIENVRGILDAVFTDFRLYIADELTRAGYVSDWRLLNACDFGVPQIRLRVVFVAIRKDLSSNFHWPMPNFSLPPTVGESLYDLISSRGWIGAENWKMRANEVAPTIVGGSHKHGGPDLGPTRARAAWAALGVDGKGIANEAPDREFIGMPRLTVPMVSRIQGFPDNWKFEGKKTNAYKQVGNAFPPPVAHVVASQIRACLESRKNVFSAA